MTIFQSIILGLVQGITEFLPISSSGHLILIPALFGWQPHSLAFDTVLHLGTASALIVYFFKDLWKILKDKNIKLIALLLIGCVPAGLVGVLFDKFFEETFRNPVTVCIFLLLGAVMMLVAELTYKKIWSVERTDELEKISYKKSLLTGVFQTIALFPGISRSGATISGGMLLGFTRELSAKFSFLLAIPIVAGAGIFKLASSYKEMNFDITLLVGYFTSFLIGLLAIKYLLKFLKTNSLYIFIIYRVILAALLLLLFT